MAAIRRRSVLAMISKLAGLDSRSRPVETGPGCTCESCLQAWDRHRPVKRPVKRESRRQLRPGLY